MTNRTLEDIRILKLAELYERSFERFVLEMAAQFDEDDAVQEHLRKLAGTEDDHEGRIAHELERLNESVGPGDILDVQRAALLDVVEVEREARAFYLRHADRVHDPAVAALFREMAAEEARHVRIAEDALAIVMRRQKPVVPRP